MLTSSLASIRESSGGAASTLLAEPVADDWSWLMRGLPMVRRTVTLGASRSFRLPRFPGTMLRGALGYALAELQSYDQLFRPTRSRSRSDSQAHDDVPPPYLVEWSSRRDTAVAAGQRWSFDLIALGRACEQIDHLIAGVEVAATAGLGIERVPHRLVEVQDPHGSNTPMYLQSLVDPLPQQELRELRLEAVTPLRLGKKREPVSRFSFLDLFQATQRRARMLARFHGELPVPPRPEELNRSASAVRVAPSNLRWLPLERGSTRQQQRIAVDGMLGTFRLQGELEPYRPLFRAALALHVGRYTTLGHGRLRVVEPEVRSDAGSSEVYR